MIREKNQWKYMPKPSSNDDQELINSLKIIKKELKLSKNSIVRKALILLVKEYEKDQTTKGLILDLDKYENEA
jgi:hypothetical protein|tara:strand:+ start:180 stop:398 length:219 start_codon:yes stop_codon:yes gene_type:complete